MDTDSGHFLHSSLREKVIEHLFVGELLRYLWINKRVDFEVLRPEVDRGGYDIAVEFGGVLRYIQLKASHKTATTKSVNVHVNLASKLNGCVVWILFEPDTLAVDKYLWFGERPGMSINLGERMARHPKANAQGIKGLKKDVRVITKSEFREMAGMPGLISELFGISPKK